MLESVERLRDGVRWITPSITSTSNVSFGFVPGLTRYEGYTTASWKYGLLDCLGKHKVSAACTASLGRREALNAAMMTACGSYCRGTTPKPGAEPCVDRLKSIYDSLDNACRTALDAHEAAKPLSSDSPFSR